MLALHCLQQEILIGFLPVLNPQLVVYRLGFDHKTSLRVDLLFFPLSFSSIYSKKQNRTDFDLSFKEYQFA